MSKNIKIRILVFFMCVCITYLAFAFIMLKIDFRDWEQRVRGFYVVCQLFSAFIALAPAPSEL